MIGRSDNAEASKPLRDWRDVEIARLRAWIKGAPHRMDCPSRSLPDHYQGQQVPCTCGRNHLLGDE